MSEEKSIPAEMLDAATEAIAATQYCSQWGAGKLAEVSLQAAGVPALLARIAEMEAELGEANLIAEARSTVGMDLLTEADRQDARIAELEAALRDRICEGCDKLMANVGQLHLCGCQDQRNLCSACKAGCACAGGE